MNWEAIGAIGEVVGAIGVIATLVYLAAQIRQNSNVVRSATRQAISTAQTDVGFRLAGNPDLGAAVARWRVGEAASSPDEAARDDLVRRSILRMFENQYHQHKDGTFEDAMWAGYLETMTRIFSQPAFREWWSENQTLFSTDFASFVQDQFRAIEHGSAA
jgi:hypothetical protein